MTTPTLRIWAEQVLLQSPRSLSHAWRPSAKPFTSTLRMFDQKHTPALAKRFLHQSASPRLLLHARCSAVRPRHTTFRRRYASQHPDPTPHLGSPEPTLSLTQRLKKLGREYGALSIWVYLGLTALDFPFCYLLVKWLGAERVGHYEHIIVEGFKSGVRTVFPDFRRPSKDETSEPPVPEGELVTGDQAARGHGEGSASLWTTLVLAYAVHKSLIFIRIPLTAALLPKVAKTLRGWGWNVGKGAKKAVAGKT